MSEIQITLDQIKEKNPCSDYYVLVEHLGEGFPTDKPFNMSIIFDVEGFEYPAIENATWVTQCLPEHDRAWRLFAVWCARQVQHLMTDERSIATLDVAENFANGNASQEELAAARDARAAAWDAARDAGHAARDAARHAARDAAWYAAWAAARAAARAAAWDAARAAAWDAARDAAWDAARDAAWAAAWDAAWDAQKLKFLQILKAGGWVES